LARLPGLLEKQISWRGPALDAFPTPIWPRRQLGKQLDNFPQVPATCRIDNYLITGLELPE
jgi:hypothetical protein